MEENNTPKRSLRDLLPKGEAKRSAPPEYGRPIGQGTRFKPRRFPWKLYGGIVVLIIILAGGYAVSKALATATITVVPRQQKLSVDANVTAVRNSTSVVSSSTPLIFDVITIEDSESTMVPSGGTESVEKKAGGKIIVYNDFSEKAEKLIKNTRFQSPDGKIYRIQEAISVPGKTAAGPGVLEVTVFADQAGDSYNVGKTDFTVPGLKGDTRFDKIYGRSKTDISGGFIGTTKIIAEADRAKVRDTAQAALSARLKDKAKKELPAEYLSFEDASFISFSEEVGQKGSVTEAELIERGALSLIVFKKGDFARTVAQQGLVDFDEGKVYLAAPEALDFKLLSKDSISPSATQSITFSLRGPATIVWEFDATELTQALVGKTSKDYTAVLQNFRAITRANASFSPKWIKTFPNDPTKIYIEQNIEQ